jgi:hypothetical protein
MDIITLNRWQKNNLKVTFLEIYYLTLQIYWSKSISIINFFGNNKVIVLLIILILLQELFFNFLNLNFHKKRNHM